MSREASGQRRICVIAIDGLSCGALMPRGDPVHDNALQRLARGGTYGPLSDPFPYRTPLFWAGLQTGQDPVDHGIHGFTGKKPGPYVFGLQEAFSCRSGNILSFLSEAGLSTVAVNAPLSYPPLPIKGHMICGFPVPSEQTVFTTPPSLHMEIIARLGDYPLDAPPEISAAHGHPLKVIKTIILNEEKRKRVFLYLTGKKHWDFALIHLSSLERLKQVRLIAARLNPGGVPEALGNKLESFIRQAAISLDSLVDDIRRYLPPSTLMLILAKRTAPAGGARFYLRRWLRQGGYLRLKKKGKVRIHRVLRQIMSPGKPACPPEGLEIPVEWKKTTAFSDPHGGQNAVYINLKGREAEGCVRPGKDYENMVQRLRRDLEAFVDPQTGQKTISRTFFKGSSSHADLADPRPDVAFEFRDQTLFTDASLGAGPVLERSGRGETPARDPKGYFILAGPGIKEGHEFIQGTDGISCGVSFIKAALNEAYAAAYPVRTLDEKMPIPRRSSLQPAYTIEEEKQIMAVLKKLGYFG